MRLRGVSWAPFGKDGGDVFIHCETTSAFVIVPGQVGTGVERTGPVLGDGEVLEERVAQMVDVAFTYVFNAKIINY